jgi:hypothetical protein
MSREDLLALFARRATALPQEENQLLVRHLQCKTSVQLAHAVVEALNRYSGNDALPLQAPSGMLPPLM